ncbi:MAG TPA: XdhC family protein [Candidatus Dormibacteraeota bacterium]|nr:XdhC family protein [Candidatus Dormibacteraeota bacterium]
MPQVEAELAARLARGEEVVLATVIGLDGEPPSHPGAKALFSPERQIAGTLGCSEFDTQARREVADLLAAGAPALRSYRHDLGSIQVYLEPYPRRPLLVVLADTPVARSLRRWAPEVGFEVTTELPAEPWPGGLFAVHTDHDAPDLVETLERLLALEPRYVGLVGSRRHTGHHLEVLRARGFPEPELARIQTPVGLDIGARTPEEIALSILAGLVAVRRGAGGGWKDRTSPLPP